jgi:hypothetical protein
MLNKFNQLIISQMSYGAQKYALAGEETKESTDVLFDIFGANWLYGTLGKYCFRYKNLARGRDLLKISTYGYLLWLKRGYHLRKEGINDPPIDTNIKIKTENFEAFSKLIASQYDIFSHYNYTIGEFRKKYSNGLQWSIKDKPDDDYFYSDLELIDSVYSILTDFSKSEWKEISESELSRIFLLCYFIWLRRYSQDEKQDEDINHPDDKKQ